MNDGIIPTATYDGFLIVEHIIPPHSGSQKQYLPTYTKMENVLTRIHGQFIKLPEDEVTRNKLILETIVETLIEEMKITDPLFKRMFRRVFYGGSFYDGLRVGKPEEFDLDLLLEIPIYSKPELIESDISGCVNLQLKNLDGWLKQPEAMPDFKNFEKLLLDNERFLSANKALRWMQSIIDRCKKYFPDHFFKDVGIFQVLFKTTSPNSGPAVKLQIIGPEVKMDIDLIISFVFSDDKWPIDKFKSNPFPESKSEFYIVPKEPKNVEGKFSRDLYWRLSFQEQERQLLKEKNRLKSALRLLKKLRDNEKHDSIASYYIKTVFLHLVERNELSFWNEPLSYVFMTALKEYKQFIQNENIPYYWNHSNNLIGNVNSATLQNINNRLAAIIKKIENNPDKPETIATFLLSPEEEAKYMTRDTEALVVENNSALFEECSNVRYLDQIAVEINREESQKSSCIIQ